MKPQDLQPVPRPQLYDEETGQLDRAVVDSLIADDASEEQELASQIERMAQTEGWKQLEAYLAGQVDRAKDALVDENDPVRIPRLQQTARAYSNVIGYVYGRIQFLKSLREERSALPTNDPARAGQS